LFIHERDAFDQMTKMLSAHTDLPPTVIHCFTGTADQAKAYLDMGLYIGLTGQCALGVCLHFQTRPYRFSMEGS
jgi:Tat protein secretion system quality control protein TatD with DNase activity